MFPVPLAVSGMSIPVSSLSVNKDVLVSIHLQYGSESEMWMALALALRSFKSQRGEIISASEAIWVYHETTFRQNWKNSHTTCKENTKCMPAKNPQ